MATEVWNNESANIYAQYDRTELDCIHPVIFDLIGKTKSKHILDYGCGEGELIQELIIKEAIVYGYDTSEAMIVKAKEKTKSGATLGVIESGVVPLQNNSIDCSVSNLVLMMCPNKNVIKNIFAEINRVLKPEGSWIYCISHPAFNNIDFTTYRNIFKNKRNYFDEGQKYQFVLKKEDNIEITSRTFTDYHYPLSTYLNLLPETNFNFIEMKEIFVPKNEVPPYMIIKGIKR